MKRAALACALCATLVAAVARGSEPPGSGSVAGRVLVNPLSVTILVPATPVRTGRGFRIRADVANAGAIPLLNVAVTLVRPTGVALWDPARQVLARIAPVDQRRVQWDACIRNAGSYVVMARATTGSFTSESLAGVIEVTGARAPC
jgi:hypothetical protein